MEIEARKKLLGAEIIWILSLIIADEIKK